MFYKNYIEKMRMDICNLGITNGHLLICDG